MGNLFGGIAPKWVAPKSETTRKTGIWRIKYTNVRDAFGDIYDKQFVNKITVTEITNKYDHNHIVT